MGQYFAAVNTAPHKGIVGDPVDLVPGQLGGHEVVHTGLLHDLGQSAGVAEDVGQPQDAVIHTKLFLEELLAVDELTDQGFAGGQVAVGFQPHAALGLPAAFLDLLLDLLHQLGVALLQEVVQHGLRRHELVVGVLLHQLQNGSEGADHLFPGLGNGPPPCHVDVGVTDAGGDDIIIAAHLVVQVLADVGNGLFHGLVEGLGEGNPHIQQVDGLVQDGLQIQTDLVVLIQAAEGPQGNLQVVIQLVHILIQLVQLCQEVELPVQGAGVGLDIQSYLGTGNGFLEQQHFPVVDVSALADFAVDEDQELGILTVVPLLQAGVDLEPDGLAVHAFGDGYLGAEPVMGAQDTLEIRDLALELALELVGAGIVGVPAHSIGVEVLPGDIGSIGLLRAEVLAVLAVPDGHIRAVAEPQQLQLIADDLQSLINKIHSRFTSKNGV